MKQSLTSKIVTSVLCFVCHSKYEKSATRSNTLANKTNNKKSYFIRLGSEQKEQNAENVILKKYHRIKMCQKK